MFEDWDLIESSFVKQYGIRLRKDDIVWDEFCTLLSGLMSDTPLGQIVSIRGETDKNVLKNFNSEQKRIHREWLERTAKLKLDDPEKLDKEMENLTKAFRGMFGNGR